MVFLMRGRVRERGRERERKIDRERETDKERQRERQRDIEESWSGLDSLDETTDRKIDSVCVREREKKERKKERKKESDRNRNREICRKTGSLLCVLTENWCCILHLSKYGVVFCIWVNTYVILWKLPSASRVGFYISVVNFNAPQEGLSSPQPVFQLLEPVVALTEAVTVIWVAIVPHRPSFERCVCFLAQTGLS